MDRWTKWTNGLGEDDEREIRPSNRTNGRCYS